VCNDRFELGTLEETLPRAVLVQKVDDGRVVNLLCPARERVALREDCQLAVDLSVARRFATVGLLLPSIDVCRDQVAGDRHGGTTAKEWLEMLSDPPLRVFQGLLLVHSVVCDHHVEERIHLAAVDLRTHCAPLLDRCAALQQ
jgi:hypothetical protein